MIIWNSLLKWATLNKFGASATNLNPSTNFIINFLIKISIKIILKIDYHYFTFLIILIDLNIFISKMLNHCFGGSAAQKFKLFEFLQIFVFLVLFTFLSLCTSWAFYKLYFFGAPELFIDFLIEVFNLLSPYCIKIFNFLNYYLLKIILFIIKSFWSVLTFFVYLVFYILKFCGSALYFLIELTCNLLFDFLLSFELFFTCYVFVLSFDCSNIPIGLALLQPFFVKPIKGIKNPKPKLSKDRYGKTSCTSLVVWGTNLSSNVGLPQFTKLISNIINLPSQIMGLLTGLLLSDGWLSFGSKKSLNARFGFGQSFDHFEYCWHVFVLLSHYCISYPGLKTGERSGTKTLGLQIQTRSLPCLTNLFNLWYSNGKKIIPADIFHDLTPLALAHWIMGDGARHHSGIVLCTDSFSVQDIVRLINVLMIKYELECSIFTSRPNQFRLYIKAESMGQLRAIVLPYMIKSMLYKIHL